MGAAGAVMGTRFVATKESLYTEEKKLRYLSAKAVDTHRSSLHDQLGTVEQPQGIDGRLISSAFTSAYGTKAPTDVSIHTSSQSVTVLLLVASWTHVQEHQL